MSTACWQAFVNKTKSAFVVQVQTCTYLCSVDKAVTEQQPSVADPENPFRGAPMCGWRPPTPLTGTLGDLLQIWEVGLLSLLHLPLIIYEQTVCNMHYILNNYTLQLYICLPFTSLFAHIMLLGNWNKYWNALNWNTVVETGVLFFCEKETKTAETICSVILLVNVRSDTDGVCLGFFLGFFKWVNKYVNK